MFTGNQISLIRKIVHRVIIFAVVFALLGNWGIQSVRAQGDAAEKLAGVSVSMTADHISFGAQDAVVLHVTLSNPNAVPVKILKWLTPLNGVDEPLFSVTKNGEEAAYLGKIFKRAAPSEADYIVIGAGASLTSDVDLSAYYDLSTSGAYAIQYEAASENLYLYDISTQTQFVNQISSNQLNLDIEGRANPKIQVTLPQAVSGTNSFVSCTASEQTALIDARNAASTYAANVLSYFSANKQGERYTWWFGTYDATRYNMVSSHFTNILNAVDTATPMTFDCGCNDSSFAYVYSDSPYNIYLCNAFWSAPVTGTDSKAGTLIHEISHFNVVAGTDDFAYGKTAAHNLALSNPSNAVQNADNHEYFAENTPALEVEVVASSLDTTGVFRPSNGLLYLKNANTTGFADVSINYGTAGDYPVAGDWDGNGTATIGIYRNGSFYLRNSNTLGFADLVFAFGQVGDQPIAGDWNGDGIDTIGIFRPSTGQFLLRNSNTSGAADMSFYLGNVGDVGIAGDWNGDGIDTTGVFRPSNGVIFMKNTNATGFADIAINYGLAGDQPVTGDWDNDGIDTIGVYRNAQFLLRNSNTLGFADIVFGLGNPGDMPISGNWDGSIP